MSSGSSHRDLRLKISPFIPPCFQMTTWTQTDKNSFQLRVFSFMHPFCPSLITFNFFFYFHFNPSPLVFLSLSLSLSPLMSISSIVYLYHHRISCLSPSTDCVSLLYTCAQTQTKAGHVGMYVQQIWRWLCDGRDERLEQLHSSLIRWCTDPNQKHNSLFLTSSPAPRGSERKRPVLCNLC